MEGTRKSLLNHIMAWVTNKLEKNEGNMYWIYGLPGIGKTSLAHLMCASLHKEKHFIGAFFCQRDGSDLRKPRNILLTLIYKLAEMFPPVQTIVAEHLRSDTNLTPESMKDSLFLDFIRNLPRHPKQALMFVIDALDECGDDQGRRMLLRSLADAAAYALWLKFIVTSRPEVDIQCFFDAPSMLSHI